MPTIGDSWGTVRGIVRDGFSFAQIKDLVGAAGLPIQRLANLTQGPGGASKGQLLDSIDALINKLDDEARDRFAIGCIEEILRRQPGSARLEDAIRRAGWGIREGRPYPLALHLDLELSSLNEQTRDAVVVSLTRYRDGDFDGAITSICGLVDRLTESIYATNSLGSHTDDSYQERVSRAFATLEASYRTTLGALDAAELARVWHNHKRAVSAAAYVLGSLRRNYSDAHGNVATASPELMKRAMDCAVFIVRSIVGSLPEDQPR